MRISVQEKTIHIDDDFLDQFKSKSWHIGRINGHFYCKHSYRDDGEVKTLYLHEYVSGYKVCGFKDENTLNCKKDNLYDKSTMGG